MMRLSKALSSWETPGFERALKDEIERLPMDSLPLQRGLKSTSYAVDTGFEAMIIRVDDAGPVIRVKTGIFFAGIVAGCSCADDPTPVEEQSEYCVVQFEIEKSSGEARVALLD